jgi:serine protease AprX
MTMQALGVSWGDRKGRRRTAAMVAAVTAVVLPVPGLAATPTAHRSVLQQVIVQAVPDALAKAEAAVTAAGGKVARQLHIVNGFSATLPSDAHLGQADGVLAVTPDQTMHLEGATYAPATDVGGPLAVQTTTGASAYYQNGYYGQGVGVALIDSGIVPTDGLHHNIFYGPDFTPQATDPSLDYLDTYGHGTFMAGLIAGRVDAAVRPYSDTNNFVGVAPEANLISLKVADATGTTAESAVVAAVDWATQHMTDKGLNIKVLNLALGAPNASYANDPLAAAVERAWSFGITVVTAAGNEGAGSLDVPAADPYAIAVGALDNQNTASLGDDKVATFSNNGNGSRNPDLIAPGAHVVSLRDPGSYIDSTYGSTGAVTSGLFRGSGTSESTAIVSGAAALVISQHPGITPDQVKGILDTTARSVVGGSDASEGHGELNLAGTYGASVPSTTTSGAHANGYATFANGYWGGSWNGNIWQSAGKTSTLLSQGRAAYASSQENGSWPATAAVDGDTTSTRWSSSAADNQWLEVDLGAQAQISSVGLTWEAAYAKAFQIQTSNDNANWTTIYSTTTGTGGTQTLNVSGVGRYVRMYGQTRATQWGFSLYEFQVFGSWIPQVCNTANAALGRPATASSYENATVNAASMAVDGDPTTRWASAWSDDQWLQVDLGSIQPLCMVSLSWEAAYATAFQVQLSNDANTWTTAYATTTGTGGLQNLPIAGAARYVRIAATTRAIGYGFSLWELGVHSSTGSGASSANDGDGGSVSSVSWQVSHWTTSHWTTSAWTTSHWTTSVWTTSSWTSKAWK